MDDIGEFLDEGDAAEPLTCPNCGATVAADELRCPSCSLPVQVACPECGTLASAEEDVCPACGTSLAHGAEAG